MRKFNHLNSKIKFFSFFFFADIMNARTSYPAIKYLHGSAIALFTIQPVTNKRGKHIQRIYCILFYLILFFMIFFCRIFIFRKKIIIILFSDLLFVGGRERGVERLIDEEQIRELKILLGSSNNNYGYNNNYNENNNFDNHDNNNNSGNNNRGNDNYQSSSSGKRNKKSSPDLIVILSPLPLILFEKRGRDSNFMMESQTGRKN